MSETRRSRHDRPRRGLGGDLSYRRPIEDRVLDQPERRRGYWETERARLGVPQGSVTTGELARTLRSWWDRFTEPFTFMFRWVRRLVLWFANWHPLGAPGR